MMNNMIGRKCTATYQPASVSTSVWNSLFFYLLTNYFLLRKSQRREARFTSQSTHHKWVEVHSRFLRANQSQVILSQPAYGVCLWRYLLWLCEYVATRNVFSQSTRFPHTNLVPTAVLHFFIWAFYDLPEVIRQARHFTWRMRPLVIIYLLYMRPCALSSFLSFLRTLLVASASRCRII